MDPFLLSTLTQTLKITKRFYNTPLVTNYDDDIAWEILSSFHRNINELVAKRLSTVKMIVIIVDELFLSEI